MAADAVQDELRDIKGFYAIEIPAWMVISLGIILVIALVVFIYFKFFHNKEQKVLTPFEKFKELTNALDPALLSLEFYLTITDAFREYLETRVETSAFDKTSEELERFLFDYEHVTTAQVREFSKVMKRSTLAKFARYEVSREKKSGDKEILIAIVDDIENAIVAKELELQKEKDKEEAGGIR